jgi:hypothetical protein
MFDVSIELWPSCQLYRRQAIIIGVPEIWCPLRYRMLTDTEHHSHVYVESSHCESTGVKVTDHASYWL